eukprot:5167764-Amphidinium_carterae.2
MECELLFVARQYERLQVLLVMSAREWCSCELTTMCLWAFSVVKCHAKLDAHCVCLRKFGS